MTEKGEYTQREIAAKSRNELVELKGKLADAFLHDDASVSFEGMTQTNNMIDRELDRRADEGDLR